MSDNKQHPLVYGRRSHNVIERLATTLAKRDGFEVVKSFSNFENLPEKCIATEVNVKTGRADIIIKDGSKITVIDIKSNNLLKYSDSGIKSLSNSVTNQLNRYAEGISSFGNFVVEKKVLFTNGSNPLASSQIPALKNSLSSNGISAFVSTESSLKQSLQHAMNLPSSSGISVPKNVTSSILKPLVFVSLGLSIANVANASDKVKAVTSEAGSWAGSAAGAYMGLIVGGPVGATIGAIVGGIVGDKAISKVYDYVSSKFSANTSNNSQVGGIRFEFEIPGFSFNINNSNLHEEVKAVELILSQDPSVAEQIFQYEGLQDPFFSTGYLLDGVVMIDKDTCILYASKRKALVNSISTIQLFETLMAECTSSKLEFSLDPYNPLNPKGPFLKKVYYPSHFLTGTSIGELFFDTDWVLKCYSFGKLATKIGLNQWQYRDAEAVSTLKLKSEKQIIIDEARFGQVAKIGTKKIDNTVETWARLWLSIKQIHTTATPSHFQVSHVDMQVNSSKQIPDPASPSGLIDVETPHDFPASKFAKLFTENYNSIAHEYPSFEVLREVAKALAISRFIKNSTCIDKVALAAFHKEVDYEFLSTEYKNHASSVVNALHEQFTVLIDAKGTKTTFSLTGGVDFSFQTQPAFANETSLEKAIQKAYATQQDRTKFSLEHNGVMYECKIHPFCKAAKAPSQSFCYFMKQYTKVKQYYASSQFSKSMQLVSRMISQYNVPTLYLLRAKMYKNDADYEKALSDISVALTLCKNSYPIQLSLLKIKLDVLIAKQDLLEIEKVQIQPSTAQKEEICRLKRPLAETEHTQIELYKTSAVNAFKAGAFIEALEKYKSILNLCQSNYQILNNAALVCLKLKGDYLKEGLLYVSQAIYFASRDELQNQQFLIKCYWRKAKLLELLDSPIDAIVQYHNAITKLTQNEVNDETNTAATKDYKDFISYFDLARNHFSYQNNDEGMKALQNAIHLVLNTELKLKQASLPKKKISEACSLMALHLNRKSGTVMQAAAKKYCKAALELDTKNIEVAKTLVEIGFSLVNNRSELYEICSLLDTILEKNS